MQTILTTTFNKLPKSLWAWWILLITLSTILYSPLMGDDLPMFQYRVENPKVESQSVAELANVMVKRFLPMGRLTVISFYYVEWVFRTFTTPIAYKSWMLVLNVLTIMLFLRWLRYIGFKFNSALLLFCMATGIQLRLNYHDSYSSYTGLCQLFNSLIFISTACWLSIYREFNVWKLAAAVLSTISLFLISEYALLLFMLIPIVFFISDKLANRQTKLKNIIGWCIPVALISMTYLCVIVFLRSNYPKEAMYSGLTSNVELGAMLKLELKQIFASIPLSNLTNTPRIPLRLLNQLKHWDVAVMAVLLVYSLNKSRILIASNSVADSSNNTNKRNYWLILGLFFWMITPVFILPSAKYQSEITWGNGYLSLMLQNLGFSLVVYGVIDTFLLARNRLSHWKITATILGLFVVVTFLFNHSLSKKYWYKKGFPADVVWSFIKNDKLKSLPENAVLVLEKDFYYKSPELYEALINDHTGKSIHVCELDHRMWQNIGNSKDSTIGQNLNYQNLIHRSPNQPHTDTSKIFGLFIKTGSQVEIKLRPILFAHLTSGKEIESGKIISQMTVKNPVSVIPADLD